MTPQNQNIMKILIAPDKFKGSLTSSQAAAAIREGIEEAVHHSAVGQSVPESGGNRAQNLVEVQSVSEKDTLFARNTVVGESVSNSAVSLEFRTVEIADGGDGSLEVLQKKIPGAEVVEVTVHDPLGREVQSQVLLYRMPSASAGAEKVSDSCLEQANVSVVAEKVSDPCPNKGGFCAFIEMAKVSGLEMLAAEERNPLKTSTYGMGEAIRAAVACGATQITLSIGGSATNDGGAGMLQALGYRFFDAEGEQLPVPIKGGQLQQIASILAPEAWNLERAAAESVSEHSIDSLLAEGAEAAGMCAGESGLSGIKFNVICDVTNPLLGQQGATVVYGPQKGADAQALLHLEAGLANYAAVAERCLGVQPIQKEAPGAGAAGGVGYAGLAFLNAELIPGWRFFAQITGLEESVQWADLVITGEGSLDSQSLSGKVVSGVLNLATRYNKEVVIFCGVNKLAPDEMEAMAHSLPKGVSCYPIASLGYPLEVCMNSAAELLQQLAASSLKTV